MDSEWGKYQEKVASFFRNLGLDAETNVPVHGVRTSHNVDVFVKFRSIGFDVLWIVECKKWKTKVNKLHVLGLRTIVNEIGADRGVLLSEAGFQSGAVEASRLTNVQVTSLADLTRTAKPEIIAVRLRELYDRIENCNGRYWNISKSDRIAHGLRQDIFTIGYSGNNIINVLMDVIAKALRGVYPIKSELIDVFRVPGLAKTFLDPDQLIEAVEPVLAELESKLDACEKSI